MVTNRILHRCSLCNKPFLKDAPDWFINSQGLDCHACEDGMVGQKEEDEDEDDD